MVRRGKDGALWGKIASRFISFVPCACTFRVATSVLHCLGKIDMLAQEEIQMPHAVVVKSGLKVPSKLILSIHVSVCGRKAREPVKHFDLLLRSLSSRMMYIYASMRLLLLSS